MKELSIWFILFLIVGVWGFLVFSHILDGQIVKLSPEVPYNYVGEGWTPDPTTTKFILPVPAKVNIPVTQPDLTCYSFLNQKVCQ